MKARESIPVRGRENTKDPFIREKFTKEQSFARKLARGYFEKYPKDRYQTEVESWRELQSKNIEFTMKRLRASQIISWPRHNRRAGSYASAAELSYPPIPHSAAIFSIWAKSRMDGSPSRKIVASKGSCGRCVITRSTAVQSVIVP